jgi:hypothetical protein
VFDDCGDGNYKNHDILKCEKCPLDNCATCELNTKCT